MSCMHLERPRRAVGCSVIIEHDVIGSAVELTRIEQHHRVIGTCVHEGVRNVVDQQTFYSKSVCSRSGARANVARRSFLHQFGGAYMECATRNYETADVALVWLAPALLAKREHANKVGTKFRYVDRLRCHRLGIDCIDHGVGHNYGCGGRRRRLKNT